MTVKKIVIFWIKKINVKNHYKTHASLIMIVKKIIIFWIKKLTVKIY
jgi:hypothetical protein